MSIPEEIDYKSYEKDLAILIKTLKDSFESTECEYHIDEMKETLFIKLEISFAREKFRSIKLTIFLFLISPLITFKFLVLI